MLEYGKQKRASGVGFFPAMKMLVDNFRAHSGYVRYSSHRVMTC